jgi:membrane associated rhomboid family serine protease
MKKDTILKLVISAILLAVTVVFILMDNEIIFPSALVGFLLVASLIGKEEVTANGKAAKYAIITFSILVITLNILISVFMPIISSGTDLSTVSVELTTDIGATTSAQIADHFVEVTINDMHELCYSTTILLLLYIIFKAIFKRKVKA